MVSTPIARTQIPVKARSAIASQQGSTASGQAAGEESTHDSTYTGVPPMAWQQMPRLTAKDKARIWGGSEEADTPRPELFDTSMGQPLVWQERKSPTFWQNLLTDLCAKTVVDYSPGSGSVARACMQMGIMYHGFAKNAEHASWLQNVLDRAALQVICTVGSPMHTDLAEAVQEHFTDVIEELNERDRAEDAVPPDGALDDEE